MTILFTAILALVGGMAIEHFRSKEWLKQEQWRYKRDIYEQLLRVLSGLAAVQKRIAYVLEVSHTERWDECITEATKYQADLHALRRLAEVFIDPEWEQLFSDYNDKQAALQQAFADFRKEGDSQILGEPRVVKMVKDGRSVTQALLEGTVGLAKKDLEFYD